MELGYAEAILLGAIQGLSEFLPISSSGHLALTQHYFGLDAAGATMLLFDVQSHLATLVAVVIVFAVPIRRFTARLIAESSGDRQRPRYAWRIAMLAVIASVPTAVIGLTLKDTFESAFDKPRWIGACLLVTGAMLAALGVAPRGRRGWKRFAWWQAGLVGVAQAGAILPGISRSGATICTAGYLGLRRRWAAEFSFLIAGPAILGGTLIKVRDTLALPSAEFEAIPTGPVLAGSATALVVGAASLVLLLGAVRRTKLHYFCVYCFLIGALVLFGVIP